MKNTSFSLEGTRRWICTSSSRSRDRSQDSRLSGKKAMYFLGRSSCWDLGWELLREHCSCALITVIKRWDLAAFSSLCSLLLQLCSEGPLWGREVGTSLVSVFRSLGANLKACSCFPQLGPSLLGRFSNVPFCFEPCTFIFTEETERSLASLKCR